MSQKRLVLQSYKQLLRAQQQAFRKDHFNIRNARIFTKQKYLESKDLESEDEIKAKLKIANDAALIIRRNIVQGVRHNEASPFVLNITPETEVNSNDTIKGTCKQPAQK
jgi:hypothetical protein